MATTNEYRDSVLLMLGDDFTVKKMMGEYLLYYKKKLIGGLYDNRLLLNVFTYADKFNSIKLAIPYENAKPKLNFTDCSAEMVLEAAKRITNEKEDE